MGFTNSPGKVLRLNGSKTFELQKLNMNDVDVLNVDTYVKNNVRLNQLLDPTGSVEFNSQNLLTCGDI